MIFPLLVMFTKINRETFSHSVTLLVTNDWRILKK